MDAIVEQALAKWPNVPHCYGWLALDARGHWRMRDEQAQQKNLPGERIQSPALLGFIQRNYAHDENGCWYFQNGPQRVYVDLEVTPHVVRTDPEHDFVLQTRLPLNDIQQVWLTDQGRLLMQGAVIALLDDRDMAECLNDLQSGSQRANEECLLRWIAEEGNTEPLRLKYCDSTITVQFIKEDALEAHFGFVKLPRPSAD